MVNPHWCKGSANATYTATPFGSLADTHGFIVIYPDSPNLADKCCDVSSAETLTHDGGGDSLGIVSMVRWVLASYYAHVGSFLFPTLRYDRLFLPVIGPILPLLVQMNQDSAQLTAITLT